MRLAALLAFVTVSLAALSASTAAAQDPRLHGAYKFDEGGWTYLHLEGTPEQMHASLRQLAALPGTTRIYPAHEYTLSNLAFALAIEPDNDALRQRLAVDRASREAGRPTLPSTLAQEMATNPFLRVDSENVRRSAEIHAQSPLALAADVFRVLREWKNGFRADSV